LVRIEADGGNRHWQSSLTRDDVGAGACELIYITQFEIIE
jgi:microcompartment protein CcmK/EutM